ncbi:unnamed protein product [Prunus armeniaca]|uniref:Uncharacterized protein n=1 Tax=Prunus armeniaca TaxID=36596 RepID=A0A6J5W4X5_PRUAR|nr:unnamed protein product [Prunus armeniaca]
MKLGCRQQLMVACCLKQSSPNSTTNFNKTNLHHFITTTSLLKLHMRTFFPSMDPQGAWRKGFRFRVAATGAALC